MRIRFLPRESVMDSKVHSVMNAIDANEIARMMCVYVDLLFQCLSAQVKRMYVETGAVCEVTKQAIIEEYV